MAKKPSNVPQSLKIPTVILATAKLLQFISPSLAARYAARLFTTPLHHNAPKREADYEKRSHQQRIFIDAIKQTVNVYLTGNGVEKVLLVHGWSGRGTQMFKFADSLAAKGLTVISFDAPAHGKSTGKRTLMPEFIATILQLDQQIGPFKYAVGHSLGGMSLLNAIARGLRLKRVVAIGSGDVIQDIIDEFVGQLGLKKKVGSIMTSQFERKSQNSMDSYSSHVAARKIEIPVLLVHDESDREVSVGRAHNISAHLKYGKLMLTKGLGHRKILGSSEVIDRSIEFLLER